MLEVCKFLLNNIEEYISETYANPVLRTALHCLAGAPHLSKTSTYLVNTFIKGISEPETTTKPPKEFAFLLKEFSTRISNWPQFKGDDYRSLICLNFYSNGVHALIIYMLCMQLKSLAYMFNFVNILLS